MENEAPHESRRRDRLMGKFFDKKKEKEREKKFASEQSANDISAFLGTANKLSVSHPPPPPPAHGHREYETRQPVLALDTSRATRYPDALNVENASQQSLASRTRSHSPPRRRRNKGLNVRFADTYPEIIGEGGDECEMAVAEIGKRKRSKSAPIAAPIPPTKQGHEYARQVGAYQEVHQRQDTHEFVPGPMRRSQTGYSEISDSRAEDPGPAPIPPNPPPPRTVPPGETTRSRFLDSSERKDENRRSFIEMQQHEQRMAEGRAFAEATRSASENSHDDWDEQGSQNTSSPEPVRDRDYRDPRDVSARNTPPRPIRKDLSQQVVVNMAPSGPARAQSQRAPPQMASFSSDPMPMRAQSQRQQMPPPPPYSRSQGLQPPARSPLPPGPLLDTNVQGTAGPLPPPRSPLRPSPVPEAPPVFRNDSVRSQRAMSPDELRLNTNITDSPGSVYSNSIYSTSDLSHVPTPIMQNPRDRNFGAGSPDKNNRAAVNAPVDDSYDVYISRTKHLYELFRLHAEQYKPLGTSKPEDMSRAALWWFLKGRMTLEAAIRNRASETDETKALMAKYQAYTDLTKAYWLMEKALPEIAESKYSPVDGALGEVRQALTSNLKKLAGSMKRNGFLPPEEPFMPQMMDKSIWVDYPNISQDIVALLNGNWGSMLAASREPSRTIDPLEALPLGDTPNMFNYGRVTADAFLMEQGMGNSTQTCFHCMLSINRPVNDSNLVFTIASQNGCVALRIQSDKNAGPTWENVRWRTDTFSLELKMPRGFMLAIQCSQQDFRMLWNIFDFGAKVQSYLYPRKEESAVFHTQLRGFHYFDADPKSRTFPKEPVGQCEVALYERILKEGSPTGPRAFHRGYRLAVVTGPKTRTLSGVTHFYPPQLPVQFAYLRGEQREPMLQLAYQDAKDKCRMVLSFTSDEEREKLLSLLKGSYIHADEELVAEVGLQGFNMTEGLADQKGFKVLGRMPWQTVRVINDKYHGEDTPPTVLAEKLRVEISSYDTKGTAVATITDRINMAPGEFKIRLNNNDIFTLMVLRNPQVDMTISLLDRPGLTEALQEFAGIQNSIGRTQTVRKYRFTSFKDLHAFQSAITGYTILYDGVAISLNIARRRMVVPVYKKWESGHARIQIVQQEKTIQMLAFFEGWSHGKCMGFVLKGTDVYEAFGRGAKAGLKIVDAKFPLPKMPDEGAEAAEDMAFVCLDMPDYAGEHDDISIHFDSEEERDKLIASLPAPVKGSRLNKMGIHKHDSN